MAVGSSLSWIKIWFLLTWYTTYIVADHVSLHPRVCLSVCLSVCHTSDRFDIIIISFLFRSHLFHCMFLPHISVICVAPSALLLLLQAWLLQFDLLLSSSHVVKSPWTYPECSWSYNCCSSYDWSPWIPTIFWNRCTATAQFLQERIEYEVVYTQRPYFKEMFLFTSRISFSGLLLHVSCAISLIAYCPPSRSIRLSRIGNSSQTISFDS